MNNIVEKALKLDQEAKNARQEAIVALHNERKNIDEQLKALGANLEPVKTKTPKTLDPNKKCAVCGAAGHDGRFHRSDKKGQNPEPPKPPAKPAPQPSK